MAKNFFLFFIVILIAVSGCGPDRQKPVIEYVMSNPAGNGSRFPDFYQEQTGEIYMSWVENIEEDIFMVRYAEYGNEGWISMETIYLGSEHYASWADAPSVAAWNGEAVAAHRYKPGESPAGSYQAEILFRDSLTGRWENRIPLLSEQPAGPHGFVNLEPLSEDSVLVVWVEGGNAVTGSADNTGASPASLHSAIFSSDGAVTTHSVMDEAVCRCCPIHLLPTDSGYAVVYKGEGSAGGSQEIRIARFDTESHSWVRSGTVAGDDESPGQDCPAEGPRAETNGRQMAVAWYAESDGNGRVNLVHSENSGQSFGDVITVAGSDQRPIGRADVLVTQTGSTYVSWLRHSGENADIMLTHVDAENSVLESHRIGTTTAETISGFPRMTGTDDAILVAWTQTSPVYRVRTARFPI